ncbi:hypothetical protein A2U01_0069868, partial [Trifolium medium]|nr:hypothetical protein [Trifolium medium]
LNWRFAPTPERKTEEQGYTARCAGPARALRQRQKVKLPLCQCTARCADSRS